MGADTEQEIDETGQLALRISESAAADEVRFDVGRHDPVAQILDESHVYLTREGVRLAPIVARLADVERAREVRRYLQYDPAPPI